MYPNVNETKAKVLFETLKMVDKYIELLAVNAIKLKFVMFVNARLYDLIKSSPWRKGFIIAHEQF